MAGPTFLDLPLELRLLIYSYALSTPSAYTISTAQLHGTYPAILDRLYGASRSPLPGLPSNTEPVILSGYSAHLLSITDPARLQLSQARNPEPYLNPDFQPTITSLGLVSRQIAAELREQIQFEHDTHRSAHLFTSFPLGLHVLGTLCPYILRQARSVHVAGSWVSKKHYSYGTPAGHSVCSHTPHLPSVAQLTALVTAILGPSPLFPNVERLEMRIYYPHEDAYASVWSDDESPVVVALRNIWGAEVDLEVCRGQKGTGVCLAARKSGDGSRKVSTVWKRLVEGKGGEKKCGEWVVDDTWPVAREEGVGRDGGGRVVFS